MDCTTEGIILKKIPHTDNSSVVHIYTREFGLLSFLVQGKNLTQKKAAYFQIGNLVDLSFNKKESGLQRIKEIGLTKGASILIDFHITQLIQFFSEITSNCIVDAYPEPELFDFLKYHWTESSNHIPLAWKPSAFVFGLTQILGYNLEYAHTVKNNEELKSILQDLDESKYPQVKSPERRAVLNYLLFNLETQVFPGKKIKTLEVIDSLYGNI